MGLDITAYSRIWPIDAVENENGEAIDPRSGEEVSFTFRAYVNPDFPGRADEIESRAFYGAVDWLDFGMGYSEYNHWRNSLAELAGYPAVPADIYWTGGNHMRHDRGAWNADSGPFWELINFSDCEGTIGTKVAAKLAADFAQFDAQAAERKNIRFYERYREFRAAFELAAEGGAVRFH